MRPSKTYSVIALVTLSFRLLVTNPSTLVCSFLSKRRQALLLLCFSDVEIPQLIIQCFKAFLLTTRLLITNYCCLRYMYF